MYKKETEVNGTSSLQAEDSNNNQVQKEYEFLIPQSIAELEIFVGYGSDKRPINPATGGNAIPTLGSTWGTLKTAIACISKYAHVNGIGVVLGECEQGVLCGLDIDYCIDADGKIAEEAQRIIDTLDTYTELSPSGRGIHCLFFAKKKGEACKNSKVVGCKCIEMYDKGRYFTLTGDRLNDKDIEHRQDECDYIYDMYFEPKTTQSIQSQPKALSALSPKAYNKSDEEYLAIGLQKDKKLIDLWSGHRLSEDESSNDMALISKLMHWSNNNIGEAINIFKKSPYAKSKDHKHIEKMNREDYLKRTAEKCICSSTAADYDMNNKVLNFINNNDKHVDLILNKFKTLEKLPHAYSRDDKGNAELFADTFKKELRYDSTAKDWRYHDGKRWKIDNGGLIAARYGKNFKDALDKYLFNGELYKNTNEDFKKHIKKLGNLKPRESMLKDAKDQCPIQRENLDKDIYLFNCLNGTLELKTFTLSPHNPDDLLGKIANVEYNPDAPTKVWERFIDDVMQGDKEKSKYLQKAVGYSLTGDTSQETLFILFGPTTRNGKSTFMETLIHLWGGSTGYATTARPETLAQKQNNDSRTANGDVARLDGARLINVSEPPKRMVFDVALLKTLTGRDKITARFLHEGEFEFIPKFKLFMNTNYLPLISDETIFSSGRINVIKFDKQFMPHEQDKTLKSRLLDPVNLSGILNWSLEGLRMFYNEGLEPPQAVKNATEEYRKDSDKIGKFIRDCLIPSCEKMSLRSVYEVYERWCKSCGLGLEGRRNFDADLRTKNMVKDSATIEGKTVRNVICGYSINEEWNFFPPHGVYKRDASFEFN